MFIRIRCTKCRIRFDTVRELLDHVATHEVGSDAAAVPARAVDVRVARPARRLDQGVP